MKNNNTVITDQGTGHTTADSAADRGQVQGCSGASRDGKAGVITAWNVHKIVEMYAEDEQTDRKAVDMATFSKHAHI